MKTDLEIVGISVQHLNIPYLVHCSCRQAVVNLYIEKHANY